MAARGEMKQKMKKQLAEDHWQIFTELDLHGESEQIKLAGFLDSMIRSFSEAGGGPSPSLQALEADIDEDGFDQERGAEDFDAPASHGSRSVKLNRGASALGLSDKSIEDYGPLPKGPITHETAKAIIEVYRRGGKLSLKSVKKILRDVYKALKSKPNIVPVETPPAPGRLHVIGDLHGQVWWWRASVHGGGQGLIVALRPLCTTLPCALGPQLADLLHILDDAGVPSKGNMFIFNGDFVDRGPHSVEIVMILFSSFLAWPGSVFLNRGNHEVCCHRCFCLCLT